MKLAILTIAAGDATYHSVTLPRLMSLAHHVGADFHAITRKETCGIAERVVGERFYTDRRKAFAWLKISELAALIPRYERVLILDSDVMPNFTSGVEWAQLFSGRSKLALDHGNGTMDECFVDWCRRKMPAGHKFKVGMPYFNSGVLSLTRDAATHVLNRWHAMEPIPVERYNDQDFLNWLVVADELAVETLPVEFNWMNPRASDTRSKAGLIHFAGSEVKALMADYDRVLPHRPF